MLEALIYSIMKDGSNLVFCKSTQNKQLVNDITRRINCSDGLVSIEKYEIIECMRFLNFYGNQDGSKFQVFWDTKARVIEMDTGIGAHR